MYQYVDPHNEGTFVTEGNRYYLTQLYGKQIRIIKSVTFFPMGSQKANAKSLTATKGLTRPVYSSGHINGKIILMFDVPGVKPEALQYYCYLDTDAMMFPPGMTIKSKVDEHEFQLNQNIIKQIEYSKLDFWGKIWFNIKPFAIPALVVTGVIVVNKIRK